MKTLIKKTLLVLMVAFIAVLTFGLSSKVKAATVAKLHTSELVEGDYVIAYNTYAMKNTVSSSRLSYSTVEVLSDKSISNPDASIVWHIAPSGDYWTIYNASVQKYAASTGAKNKAQLLTSGSDDKALWTVSFANNTFEFVNKANAAAAVNKNLRNNGTYGFACYATGTGGALSLYKVGEASSTEPSIVIAGDSNVMIGNNVTLTATTTNTTSEVVWSSSDNAVATVANGVVTPVKMGTVTITANLAEDENVSTSLTIKVYPSNENPITVADAIEVCKLTGSVNSPYKYTVVGKISSEPTYDSKYSSYTFDLTDETGTIVAYSCIGEGTPLNGNSVSVNGNLVLFNSTYEFNYNSTFEILVDENLTSFLENLNAINSWMSLAYKYSIVEKTVPVKTEEKDTLNVTLTGVTGTSYTSWADKAVTTDAVYAGQSAAGNNSIQLRSNNSNSGIVTTVSGGKAAKVSVVWNSNTPSGRTLDIYGSNTAYTDPTQLYNTVNGVKIGSIVCGTTTELEITGDYAYIGLRSNSGAMYLDSIEITWLVDGTETEKVEAFDEVDFRLKCAIDSDVISLANDVTYDWGISVTANGETKYYNSTSEYIVSDEENNKKYVVISLGDVLSQIARAKTEFTVRAYVEVDGEKYLSEKVKTFSVETMIKEYNTNEEYSAYKSQIAPLVEVLASLGCTVE